MNKTVLIVKRDYLAGVRKRAFLIMTFVGPLSLIAMASLILFLFRYNAKDAKPLAVYDETGLFQSQIESKPSLQLVFLPLRGLKSARDSVEKKARYRGLLYIPSKKTFDPEYTQKHIELFSSKPMGSSVSRYLKTRFDDFFTQYKLRQLGVDQQRIEAAKTQVKIGLKNFQDEDTSRVSEVAPYLSYSFIFLMYLFVFIYGVRVMRGVLEEKLNRIVEVVISSVKPVQLMLGKVFSSALIGLTQFAIWGLLLGGLALSLSPLFSEGLPQLSSSLAQSSQSLAGLEHSLSALGQIDLPLLLFAFLFFFTFGVLTYNSLFAAIGAAVDNQTDTQQFLMVVSIPIAVAVYGSISIAQNPDGAVAFWLSILPLTSPIAMMARIPFGVPPWQLALSMTLLVAFFLFMIWLAARIYKVGILLYGKKASWKELYKWLKY